MSKTDLGFVCRIIELLRLEKTSEIIEPNGNVGESPGDLRSHLQNSKGEMRGQNEPVDKLLGLKERNKFPLAVNLDVSPVA